MSTPNSSDVPELSDGESDLGVNDSQRPPLIYYPGLDEERARLLNHPSDAPPGFAIATVGEYPMTDDQVEHFINCAAEATNHPTLAVHIVETNRFADVRHRVDTYRSLLRSARASGDDTLTRISSMYDCLKNWTEPMIDTVDSVLQSSIVATVRRMRAEVRAHHSTGDWQRDAVEWSDPAEVEGWLSCLNSPPWPDMDQDSRYKWAHEIVRQALTLQAELDLRHATAARQNAIA